MAIVDDPSTGSNVFFARSSGLRTFTERNDSIDNRRGSGLVLRGRSSGKAKTELKSGFDSRRRKRIIDPS